MSPALKPFNRLQFEVVSDHKEERIMANLDGMSSEERRKYIHQHNESHLIRFVGKTEPEALEDLLLIMAKNVESAMVTAGAEPGKDYTYRDLFTLAMPLVLEVWKTSGKVHFAIEDF
jgi:hypothetical protein